MLCGCLTRALNIQVGKIIQSVGILFPPIKNTAFNIWDSFWRLLITCMELLCKESHVHMGTPESAYTFMGLYPFLRLGPRRIPMSLANRHSSCQWSLTYCVLSRILSLLPFCPLRSGLVTAPSFVVFYTLTPLFVNSSFSQLSRLPSLIVPSDSCWDLAMQPPKFIRKPKTTARTLT